MFESRKSLKKKIALLSNENALLKAKNESLSNENKLLTALKDTFKEENAAIKLELHNLKVKQTMQPQVISIELPAGEKHEYVAQFECDKFRLIYCKSCNEPAFVLDAKFEITDALRIILQAIPGVNELIQLSKPSHCGIRYDDGLDRGKMATAIAEKVNNYIS